MNVYVHSTNSLKPIDISISCNKYDLLKVFKPLQTTRSK